MENAAPVDLSSSSTENLAEMPSFLIPSPRPHSSLFEPFSDISNKLIVPKITVSIPDPVHVKPEFPVLTKNDSFNVKSAALTGSGTATGPPCAITPFYCEDCKIYFNSLASMSQHKDGRRHRYAINSIIKKIRSTPDKRCGDYFCDTCRLTFDSEAMLRSHLSGRKHLARVSLVKMCGELQQPKILTDCSQKDESVSFPSFFTGLSDAALPSTHSDVDENCANPMPSSVCSAPSETFSSETKNGKLVGLLQHICMTQILSLIGFPERCQTLSNTKADLDELISLIHCRCNEICVEGFSQSNQHQSHMNKEHKNAETSESLLLLCWCQQLISLSGIGHPSS
ncbi:unnamed protein product [Calicophoron daubneyi]|uniref:C2H2-type domain-containing protein n=1 Tax=Calicophoron daubneyi TaxID=300641 RepID=A0AAV2TXS5_CALDB